MSRSVSDIYAEIELKKKARNKKIKLGLLAVFVLYVAFKFFTGDVNYTRTYSISAAELGINPNQLQNTVSKYRLQNDRVLNILNQANFTFDEFTELVLVETFIPTTGEYMDLEFTAKSSEVDLEPIYKAIANDIVQFTRANK